MGNKYTLAVIEKISKNWNIDFCKVQLSIKHIYTKFPFSRPLVAPKVSHSKFEVSLILSFRFWIAVDTHNIGLLYKNHFSDLGDHGDWFWTLEIENRSFLFERI